MNESCIWRRTTDNRDQRGKNGPHVSSVRPRSAPVNACKAGP
jgi:hypothetical protein